MGLSRGRGACTKIHPHLGHSVDGCQEYDGDNPEDLLACGCCGCDISFHLKLNVRPHEFSEQPNLKKMKVSSPAVSVGDNISSLEMEADTAGNAPHNASTKMAKPTWSPPGSIKLERDHHHHHHHHIHQQQQQKQQQQPARYEVVQNPTKTLLYGRLCSKVKQLQEQFPADIHGKFSIEYDDIQGYRVRCGGCQQLYGIPKLSYSLGNFERGHLKSKKHYMNAELMRLSKMKLEAKKVEC